MLATYLSDHTLHFAMQVIIRDAISRQLSQRMLADLVGRDETALARSLLATTPRRETIKDLGKALAYDTRAIRALAGELTASDVKFLRWSIEATAAENALASSSQPPDFERLWLILPDAIMKDALGVYLIAFEGLINRPPLTAFAETVGDAGFSFEIGVGERGSPKEAAIAMTWLRTAASLSPRDSAAIWSIVERSLGLSNVPGETHPALLEPGCNRLAEAARQAVLDAENA